MKAIRKFAASLAMAALAGLASGAVQGATYEVGTLSTTPWTSSTHGAGNVAPGSFTDIYNFTVGDLATTAATEVELNLQYGSQNILHISNMQMQLFDAANHLLFSHGGSPISWTGTLDSLASYRIELSGLADGTAGGAYQFAIAAVSAAPTPEPGTWLLMALGLGVVGYLARRRQGGHTSPATC